MADEPEDPGRRFEQHVSAWFGGGGRATVSDRTYLRQMNMAIALAYSKWLELAGEPAALDRMLDWLDEVERRAVTRDAVARAEAVRKARAWLDPRWSEPGKPSHPSPPPIRHDQAT